MSYVPHSSWHQPNPAALAPSALWAAVCLTLSFPAAHAQQTDELPTVTVIGKVPRGLEAPASTGSRLDLTPMQTPASVEVIAKGQLRQRGDSDLMDAITRATGITSLAHPGNSGSALSARGFTDAASVMRLYDGMRQYGGVGVSFPFDTWSVERIEVLRGPASVIYGDGAIGGVVNVVPRKPERGTPRHEVQATVGTEGRRALAFDSTGAINQALSYRFDISGDEADGWVDRGESRSLSWSGALRLDVSPDLHVTLSHAQGDQRPMRYFGMPLVNGRALSAIKDNNYNVADGQIRYKDRWTDLSVQWAPSSQMAVRSRFYHVQSNRYWRNAEAYVYDAGSGLVNRSDNTEIAHDQTQSGNTTDLTLTGKLWGLPSQLSVGFDVNGASFTHTNNTYTGSSGPVDLYNPVPGQYQSSVPFIPRYRNSALQYALFAENKLDITPAWSLIAGLRHDRADLSRTNLLSGAQAFDKRYENTGWRLGTVYQLQPDLALYAQYARAADPVSGLLMLSPANSQFDLSTGRQAEVGLKQRFWGGRGDWTLALYEIVKNKVITRDPANPATSIQAGQRSTQGIEATVGMAVTPTVRLDANAALLKARFDDFRDSTGVHDGKVPPNVPQRVANVWLGWTFMPDWTVSGGLRHVGKRFADNADTLKLPTYTTADMALQWRASSDTTVALRGFNVLDKTYFTTAYYTSTQWLVGEGRRLELTLNHKF